MFFKIAMFAGNQSRMNLPVIKQDGAGLAH